MPQLTAMQAADLIRPRIAELSAALTPEHRHLIKLATDVAGLLGLEPHYANVSGVVAMLEKMTTPQQVVDEYPKMATKTETHLGHGQETVVPIYLDPEKTRPLIWHSRAEEDEWRRTNSPPTPTGA